MSISTEEVFETASMILHQNLDIRTTTLGINLKDCINSDFTKFTDNVYQKVQKNARQLVEEAEKLELKYGIPIVNKRISITPISLIMETHCRRENYVEMAKTMEADDFLLEMLLGDCKTFCNSKRAKEIGNFECGRTRSHVWIHQGDERVLMLYYQK